MAHKLFAGAKHKSVAKDFLFDFCLEAFLHFIHLMSFVFVVVARTSFLSYFSHFHCVCCNFSFRFHFLYLTFGITNIFMVLFPVVFLFCMIFVVFFFGIYIFLCVSLTRSLALIDYTSFIANFPKK